MRAPLVAVMLAAAPYAAHAHGQPHGLRVGAGVDVLHEHGMAMLSVAADPFVLLAWDRLDLGLGASYRFGDLEGWSASAGGVAVRRTDGDLGTRLNFLLGASYCGKAVCLSFAHISHGALLGIERGAANSGLNFVFLEYRLR
jgi:hypothetical protein